MEKLEFQKLLVRVLKGLKMDIAVISFIMHVLETDEQLNMLAYYLTQNQHPTQEELMSEAMWIKEVTESTIN